MFQRNISNKIYMNRMHYLIISYHKTKNYGKCVVVLVVNHLSACVSLVNNSGCCVVSVDSNSVLVDSIRNLRLVKTFVGI